MGASAAYWMHFRGVPMIRRRGHPVTGRCPTIRAMSAPLYAAGLSRHTAPALPWWLRMLSSLPLAFFYALATALVWVMRRIVRHRVETVRTNIERSFPQLSRREQRL